MSARKNAPAPVVFDFSRAGEAVAIPAKPADGLSADKRDAVLAARNAAYRTRAGLKLDALEDAMRAHTGDIEAQVRAMYTWVAQCTKADYSLADAARDSGKADVQTREDAKVASVVKALEGMSKADIAALLAKLGK